MRAANHDQRGGWHPLWQLMWFVTTPTWIAIAFAHSVTGTGKVWGLPTPLVAPSAFLVLFFVPEMLSIRRSDDRLPPLTHMIRGYVIDDFAFPLIYFLVGSLGGRWFGFPMTRFLGLGAITAILGWLTIHFTMAYLGPNPRPRPAARADLHSEAPRSYIQL